jgi:flagellin-like protein
MYHKKWNKKGVSPVIATILMVAITVVLAAVLYVMVIGFGGGSAKPTIGFLPPTKESGVLYKMEMSDISPSDTDLAKFKVMVTVNSTTAITAKTLANGNVGVTPTPGITIVFNDLTGNGKLNKGDYFTFLFSVAPGNGISVVLSLLWSADDSKLGEKGFST